VRALLSGSDPTLQLTNIATALSSLKNDATKNASAGQRQKQELVSREGGGVTSPLMPARI